MTAPDPYGRAHVRLPCRGGISKAQEKAMQRVYRALARPAPSTQHVASLRPHGAIAKSERGAILAQAAIRRARQVSCANAVATAHKSRSPVRGKGPAAELARLQEASASAAEGLQHLARTHGIVARIGTADAKRLAALLASYGEIAATPDASGLPNLPFLSRLASA